MSCYTFRRDDWNGQMLSLGAPSKRKALQSGGTVSGRDLILCPGPKLLTTWMGLFLAAGTAGWVVWLCIGENCMHVPLVIRT